MKQDLHEVVGMVLVEELNADGEQEWIGSDEQWAEFNRLSSLETDHDEVTQF